MAMLCVEAKTKGKEEHLALLELDPVHPAATSYPIERDEQSNDDALVGIVNATEQEASVTVAKALKRITQSSMPKRQWDSLPYVKSIDSLHFPRDLDSPGA